MAPKRAPPVEDPPSASSSDEEETSSGEEEASDDERRDPTKGSSCVSCQEVQIQTSVAATPEKSTAVKRGNGADRDPKNLKRAKNKNGYDPSKDMNAFFDFIKKSLHFDVSMTQLKDKISSEGSIKANGKKNTNFNGSKTGNVKKLEALKTGLAMDAGEEERMDVEMERDSSVKKVLKFDRNASVGTMDDYVVRSGLDFSHGMKRKRWRRSRGSCI
ncbi:hypothetical protein OIU85_014935 [Salix viminalis]|uniref:Glabrous enhancer-binding protein-like DBD domain-containing protein n=1 Tax=Salix viminalis TaxID=40686 RepID=A0A9Q0SB86_SALVM|nr:hypothetical protein OIU85_014935 [Salix viminalis]